MERLTGGDAIADSLLRHGIDTLFGLPGAQLYGLFDALARRSERIRVITPRHEQACGYMALGFAKASGRPGVYAVVPGPGVLNTAAALITAYGNNAPVLCLTGQVPSEYLGRGRGHLHELPDQLATLRLLTKHAERVEHPSLAPRAVAAAFQQMQSGRKGPAAIEAPWDFFTHEAPVEPHPPLAPWPAPPPDPAEIERAVELIAAARAPMIMVGGGALDAGAAVLDFAELLDAPVVSFRSGRGIVPDDHGLGATVAAAYELWPETDVLIGIGTRLEVPSWRWRWRPPSLKTVRIDVDPAEMRRLEPDAAIVADATDGTAALAAALRRRGIRASGRRERIAAAKRAAAAKIERVQPQAEFLRVIRAVLPRDAIFVDEVSLVGFASIYAFAVYAPRTFLSSGYQGTLGAGFPMALGAKVACPERPVVSITGDGGFMFAVQELATAVQHEIALVTIVFDNGAFGNVRRDQQQRFAGRMIGADLVNPDFVRLAESFGVEPYRAPTPAALEKSLEAALSTGRPCLIHVPIEVGSEASPWSLIHPPPPSSTAA